MGEVKREAGPDAEAPCPSCGLCGDETVWDGDGGFQCDSCGIRYDADCRFAAWLSEDDCDEAEQCPSRAVFLTGGGDTSAPRRCLLHAGHRGPHRRHWLTAWPKDTPPLGTDAAVGAFLNWRTVTEEQAAEIEAAEGGGRRG